MFEMAFKIGMIVGIMLFSVYAIFEQVSLRKRLFETKEEIKQETFYGIVLHKGYLPSKYQRGEDEFDSVMQLIIDLYRQEKMANIFEEEEEAGFPKEFEKIVEAIRGGIE